MCIICVELIKHKMTLYEAERASLEMVLTSKDGIDTNHYRKLNKSIREMDIKTLGDTLEEGKNHGGLSNGSS